MTRLRRFAAVILVLLPLGACEGTSKREAGTAIGAAVGLGLGIALALATGTNPGDSGLALGGAIGAAVGAAVGGAVGDGLDREDRARAASAAAAAASLPNTPPPPSINVPPTAASPPTPPMASKPSTPAHRQNSQATLAPASSVSQPPEPQRVVWRNPQNPQIHGYSEPLTPAVSGPVGVCRQVRSVYLLDGREQSRDARFCFRDGAWREAA